MLSSVLKSPRAVQVNISIMRTFVRIRRALMNDAELALRIKDIERRQQEQDANIESIFDAFNRMLALPDPRASALAASNIEILIGTLLRPLHRKTRLAAFDALVNAARHNEAVARRVHARAREALKLPNKKYPKPELIGLIGRVLAVCPGLASEAERPVVYRNGKAAA